MTSVSYPKSSQPPNLKACLHDAYAAAYEAQVQTYDCHLAEILFGLCYEFTRPGQRLLDVGIGSGLSSQIFAKAGLAIYGMDFSAAMLELCQAKGFAVELKQHDLSAIPWPYSSDRFDHLICCGVFHFLPDLEDIFSEARRVLAEGGVFAFTTRLSVDPAPEPQPSPTGCEALYHRQIVGDFEIFSHIPAFIQTLLGQHSFEKLKMQKCFVGDDLFVLWIVGKRQRYSSSCPASQL